MALKDDDAASYFDSLVDRFGGWVQYGDTKAGAVLVVFGLGLADLLGVAHDLINAHRLQSDWGWVATGAFWGTLAAAALAVAFLGAAVFQTLRGTARIQQKTHSSTTGTLSREAPPRNSKGRSLG